MLVIGSMISLGYYLRVIAAMWMSGAGPGRRCAGAGGAGAGRPGADRRRLARGRRAAGDAGDGTDGAVAGCGAQSAAAARSSQVTLRRASLFAAASVFFGIFPSPLFNLAAHAGRALTGLF